MKGFKRSRGKEKERKREREQTFLKTNERRLKQNFRTLKSGGGGKGQRRKGERGWRKGEVFFLIYLFTL